MGGENPLRKLSCFPIPFLLVSLPVLAQLTPEQVVQQASPSIAMVLVNRALNTIPTMGTGVVVNKAGVLLVPHHLVKDA